MRVPQGLPREQLTAGLSSSPESLQNLSIEYDKLGNVAQRQSGLASLADSLVEDFLYGEPNTDKLDRLTHVDLTTGTTSRRTLDLEYDDFGNIQTKTEYDGTTPLDMDITWTSFNYPSTITAGSLNESARFSYGPDRQRWRMAYASGGHTETTYYVGDLMEKVVTNNGVEYRHYIPGPGEIIGLYSRAATGTDQLRYLLTDHQGSLDVIVDGAGTNPTYSSFAPFGTPRDPNDWSGPGSTPNSLTRQGYTFHTVLGRMGLNHMNGRVQDAISGTFLSPDPFITDPLNTQNFNRYAYVYNNPLTFTDPSGFAVWGDQDDEDDDWDFTDNFLDIFDDDKGPDDGFGHCWTEKEQSASCRAYFDFYMWLFWWNREGKYLPVEPKPNTAVAPATPAVPADRRATASMGGATTYEQLRSSSWLDKLNPARLIPWERFVPDRGSFSSGVRRLRGAGFSNDATLDVVIERDARVFEASGYAVAEALKEYPKELAQLALTGVAGELVAARAGSHVAEAGKKIESWLGPGAKAIKNDAGDLVMVSRDGTRRVRFDVNRPYPHESPHGHVEELVDGRWQKSGPVFPNDVPKR
jgi:RHS repeat-associated protein